MQKQDCRVHQECQKLHLALTKGRQEAIKAFSKAFKLKSNSELSKIAKADASMKMQELQMALNAAECVNDEECSSDAVFEALKSEAASFLQQLERNMTHLGHASKKFAALKQVGAAAAYRHQA